MEHYQHTIISDHCWWRPILSFIDLFIRTNDPTDHIERCDKYNIRSYLELAPIK